jgi:hypothetical protein
MILSLLSPATTSFAQGDIARPTLHSLTVSAKEATVGDKVKISVDVKNDLTGVKKVRVYYSTLYESHYAKSIDLNYNSTTGKFEGTFNVEKDDRDSEWYLTSIYVNDNQGNEYSFEGDPSYKYNEDDNHEYRDFRFDWMSIAFPSKLLLS